MQPAFGLGQTGPAAGPGVFARRHGAGAGGAPDGRVPLREQGIGRHRVGGGVVEQLVEAPRGDGVDLHHLVDFVPLHQSGVGAQGIVFTAHAGDPRLVAGQGLVDRVDLAQLAAQRRFAVVQLGAVLGVLGGHGLFRQHVDDGHRGVAGQRVTGLDGFGEVVAGLQKQHVDAGQVPGDQVRHHGVAGHRARHGDPSGEVRGGPRGDIVGRPVG